VPGIHLLSGDVVGPIHPKYLSPYFNFIFSQLHEILVKGDGGEITSGVHEEQQQVTTCPACAHVIN
jgi:hypothetical protein